MAKLRDLQIPNHPLLSDDEATSLIKKSHLGDKNARDKLINSNLKLVLSVLRRFENRGYDLDDLFQIGTIGLMKSIDKFDLTLNVKFSTYAVPMIIGEIRRFFRDDNYIKVARSVKETAYHVQRAREELEAIFGREATVSEIALKLEISEEQIVEATDAMRAPSSIHETLYHDDSNSILILDRIKDDTPETLLVEKMNLLQAIEKLPPYEKAIILQRFYYDRTQTEIASLLGISQVQVSRIEKRALKLIKNYA